MTLGRCSERPSGAARSDARALLERPRATRKDPRSGASGSPNVIASRIFRALSGPTPSSAGGFRMPRSLTGLSLVALVAVALVSDERRARSRPDAEGGWSAQRHAARGPVAGLRDPRDVDHLDGVAGQPLLQQPRATTIPPRSGEHGHHHPRAGREVVVAGQLPQPRLLPPQGRQVARRQAVHLAGREVHVRHGARAPDAKAKLKVNPRKLWYDEHRGHRGARPLHGGLPAQAARSRRCC